MSPENPTPPPLREHLRAHRRALLVGAASLLAACLTLALNERAQIRRAEALAAGRDATVEVEPLRVLPENSGRLVLLVGPTSSPDLLRDPRLGLTAAGARLRWTVEMYQWAPAEPTESGGERWERIWSASPVDSESEDAAHENPDMPLASGGVDAARVSVGAYRLTPELIAQMDAFEPLVPDAAQAAELSLEGRSAHAKGASYFLGEDPEHPEVGDLRVTYEVVRAGGEVTVLGGQQSDTFAAWTSPNDQTIEPRLRAGRVPLQEMIADLADRPGPLPWLLRLLSLGLFFLGLYFLLRVLGPRAAGRAWLEGVVGGRPLVTALALSPGLWLLAVAVAWLTYSLVRGVFLGLLAGALLAARPLWKRRRRVAAAAAAPNP